MYGVAFMFFFFFALELLCTPCSQSSHEEPRRSASDDALEESLASRHHAPLEDICRDSAQHKR